ncbi:MAG: glycosyltransferase [Deltaproteobacteria bacterium]|nr:glycosyltransferase [Deltaproteobacteria bacterium]
MTVDVAWENARIREKARKAAARPRAVDVAVAARANLFVQPGGDTELAIGFRRGLHGRGLAVDYRQRLDDKLDYRLAHVLNPDVALAIQAAASGRPYVITPLFEDFARFAVPSVVTASLFRRHLEDGDLARLEAELASLRESPISCDPPADFAFAVEEAMAVLPTGAVEAESLARHYPRLARHEVLRLPFHRPDEASTPSGRLFEEAFGVKDFVLCVGRLETRKNQLMLAHALRDDERPLVFVNGGSSQPQYEALCRRYERRGPTVFTGRLSGELLASAFCAASVHALPSWYELPGLVSLQAAWAGCPVVASDWGTLRDYLGDDAHYCAPDNPASIRAAVDAARAQERSTRGRERLAELTWERAAEQLRPLYRRVLDQCGSKSGSRRLAERARRATRRAQLLQAKAEAVLTAETDPAHALRLTAALLGELPADPMVHYLRGVAALGTMQLELAREHLAACVERAPILEGKAYLYLYLILTELGDVDGALSMLDRAELFFPFRGAEIDRLLADYRAKAALRRRGGAAPHR